LASTNTANIGLERPAGAVSVRVGHIVHKQKGLIMTKYKRNLINISIIDNDLDSIKKAEKLQARLWDKGYKVTKTVCKLNHSIITMELI